MSGADRDPTRRFSSRVENYALYRPSYPVDLIDVLGERLDLAPADVVVDLGSGTGLLSALFLDNGNTVLAVEPNRAMREAGDRLLGHRAGFRSVDGRAEATTLDAGSADVAVAGQAFHWFDPAATRLELARILGPAGRVALVWNNRDRERSRFMEAYEDLLARHGTDYRRVDHQRIDPGAIPTLFGHDAFERAVLPNEQVLDRSGLRGRLLSSSYVPGESEPGAEAMLARMDAVFDDHEAGGTVRLAYVTEVFLGRLAPA